MAHSKLAHGWTCWSCY